ncbi:MAG TPA: flagellar export chaperone FliS [Azospira sp.]|nr:flagellar export chaperone FliS [Azospira sp.]
MFSNPIASYQQISRDADIRGSDPHRLIQLLFDGAIAALEDAKVKIAEKDIGGKSDSIVKAITIISDGLSASLNLNGGGELAEHLKALYDYMVSRLVHANVHNDVTAIDEVKGLLDDIGGAWREMGQNLKATVGQTP